MDGFERVVGHSARFDEVMTRARRLSRLDAPVLLQGETGVGKEVFARAIHQGGPRHGAALVALNCGGVSRELLASELFGYVEGAFTGARRSGMVGKIEAADGGTLFLDEIAEMPLDLQPYLLRVLEDGEFYPLGSAKPRLARFRLIAACNRELRGEVAAGRFREDLYYRLSATSLHIPALRERKDDLPLLVAHFARELSRRQGVPVKRFLPEVLLLFARHSWPGNLRELRNIVEIMALLAEGEVVDLAALPPDFPAAAPIQDRPAGVGGGLQGVEKDIIRTTIRRQRGNLARAAKDLGMSRSTLYLKLKRYELDSIVTEARFAARQSPMSVAPTLPLTDGPVAAT
jgi:sigma-54 dependent transcriptional regulator, acetoin dehydrogenase operon transcriptional activator AcoR